MTDKKVSASRQPCDLKATIRKVGEVKMKETERVPFDSMPPLIRGSFLTKKQEEKLKELFKDVVSVVRCKDCNNGVIYCDNGDIICDHVDSNGNDTHPADWFCADGVRRE